MSSDFTNFVNLIESNIPRLPLITQPQTVRQRDLKLVRTFKEAMKIFKNNGLTLAHQVNNFLLDFTVQPHT